MERTNVQTTKWNSFNNTMPTLIMLSTSIELIQRQTIVALLFFTVDVNSSHREHTKFPFKEYAKSVINESEQILLLSIQIRSHRKWLFGAN